jgi:hypothetical protein
VALGEADPLQQHLEGISLRRVIGAEPQNREQATVRIERELLQELERRGLERNFAVNLAIELLVTRSPVLEIHIARVERQPAGRD